jgi:hypothetical protein
MESKTNYTFPDASASAKPLDDDDRADLESSGLTEETIRDNGLFTVTKKVDMASILNRLPDHRGLQIPEFCYSGGLVFPYLDLDGADTGFARVKPHHPRYYKHKPVKYESPVGSVLRAYFPVASRALLKGGTGPVFITEGEKKALALSQLDRAVVGIGGIWCGCQAKKKELLDDLAALPWAGRTVYIVFDHDPEAKTRRTSLNAGRRLAGALLKAGAQLVYYVELPPGRLTNGKNGVDDFLVAKGDAGPEEFQQLVEQAKRLSGRVEVILGTDEFRVNAQAEKALAESVENFYQRGNRLTHAIRVEPDEGPQPIKRPTGSPEVRDLHPAVLREELTRYVDFVVKKGEDKIPAHPPSYAIQAILHRGSWKGFPRLEGVVSHPVIFPDGTILAEPDYDPASRLLLWMPGGLQVEVPENPTLEDAKAAITVLKHWFLGFRLLLDETMSFY